MESEAEPARAVYLHDNRRTSGGLAGSALALAVSFGAKGAHSTEYGRAFYALAVLFAGVAVLFGVIAAKYPRTLLLSRDGLTMRTRSGVYTMPTDAIEALGVTKVGNIQFITLWYDVQAIPALPADLEFYVGNQAPCGNGKIYLEAVGPPTREKKIESVHRLVQQEKLGEWRDYPT
jgi:hypothetical protein